MAVFNISFTPKLKLEASASISVSLESELYFGIAYDTNSKTARPFSTQSSDTSISVGGTFFVGIVAEVAFGDITGDILEIAFEPSVGFKVEGDLSPVSSIKANKEVIACDVPGNDMIHGCNLCIEGNISLVAEGTVELNLLSLFNKEPTLELPIFEITIELGDFYLSDKEGFGWGQCPNNLYRVTFNMKYVDKEDEKLYPLKDTVVSLGGVGSKTDENGIAYFYCRSFYLGDECLGKTYNYSSVGDTHGTILVKDQAQTIFLKLYKDANGNYTCSNNVSQTTPSVTTVTTKATTAKTTVATKYERQEQVAIESGELGKNRGSEDAKDHIYYILYNDGNMFIYGSGEMDSFSRSPFRNIDKIKYVSIENTSKGTITNIGQGVFQNCVNLEDVIYPSSVTSIDNYAFYNCPKLNTTYDLSNIISIGSYAFYGCESITDVQLPNTVSIINDHTFAGIGAESIVLPESIISLGGYAFADCKKLESITLPDANKENKTLGVINIDSYAFANCTSLAKLVIPDSVETMGANMLNGCTNLEKLTIPFASTSKAYAYNGNNNGYSEVSDLFVNTWTATCNAALKDYAIKTIEVTGGTHIPNSAFYQMDMLKEVIIPKTITNIDANAFYQCTGLDKITITNRKCNIYDSENTIAEETVIYGYKDSTSQNYADSYSRIFVPIDGEIITTTITTTMTTTTATTVSKSTTSTKTNTSAATTTTASKPTTSTTTNIHTTTTTTVSKSTTSTKINTSAATTTTASKPTTSTTTNANTTTTTTASKPTTSLSLIHI